MRKPRPKDFDPAYKEPNSPKPDQVDVSGIVAIKPKSDIEDKVKPKQKDKASNHDSMPPRHHATTVSWHPDTMIEVVRKAVKDFGKEAATHRFTQEEKQMIADLVYSYKRQGIKTSENEITRIAINFITEDHKENKDQNILDRVLKALND